MARLTLPLLIAQDEDHLLLLLSDSALPIGSFAFSSGLESFFHHSHPAQNDPLGHFIRMSLPSIAYSTLPFIRAAYESLEEAISLDEQFDATVLCPVARRASLAQGKALLTIWERAFLEDKSVGSDYRGYVKSGQGGHYGIAWGAVCANCNISLGMIVC
jgi:urease accessory protein